MEQYYSMQETTDVCLNQHETRKEILGSLEQCSRKFSQYIFISYVVSLKASHVSLEDCSKQLQPLIMSCFLMSILTVEM